MSKNEKHPAKIVLHLRKFAKSKLLGALKSIHRQEAEASTLEHSHDYYEMAVVVYGDGFHCMNGKQIPLHRGQVFLTPPGKCHHYAKFHQIVLQNFMIGRRALSLLRRALATLPNYPDILKNGTEGPVQNLQGSDIAFLDLLVNNISLENRQFQPGKELMLLSYLTQLMSRVFCRPMETGPQEYANGNIEMAIAYMQRNYQKELKLPEVAKYSSMSVSSFIQQFRQEFKIPPMRWLLELRLHHARQLLMRSNRTISKVAQECGFSDPLYFTRQFRKRLGCTPTQFRKHGQGPIQILQGNQSLNDDTFLFDN